MRYISIFCLFIGSSIPCFVYADGLYEEASRKIEKAYQLDGTEVIEIKNKHGKVEVLTWDKNEALLSVLITAKASSKEKARDRLEEVDIRERRLGSKIQLETRLLNTNFQIGIISGVNVAYTLHLPASSPLEIQQGSGDILLDSRDGNVDIQLGNGYLSIEELRGGGNNLEIEFADAEIGFIEAGDIQFSFGKLDIEEAGDIYLKSNTARIEIGRIFNLEIFANLGEIRIDEIENLSGDYTSAKFVVGKLTRSVDLEAKYAIAFEIEEVAPQFERIKVETTFATVDLKFAPEALFELQAETKRGNMEVYELNMEISEYSGEDNRIQYQATPTITARTDQTVGKVYITTRNGKVKLSRNN